MTNDNEVEEFAKDVFGVSLKIGDEVIFMRVNYRSFDKGKIKSLSKQSALIEHDKNNLGSTESRQRYDQIFRNSKQPNGLLSLDISKLKKYSGIYGLPPKEYTLVNVEDLQNMGVPEKVSVEDMAKVLWKMSWQERDMEFYIKQANAIHDLIYPKENK